ncbi:hypothetical protein EV08_1060 [Prochlorococcus marinus str. SS2]|nr:hypothetical protein EV08_1060 [Prochlorococcus marinus str. SS2]
MASNFIKILTSKLAKDIISMLLQLRESQQIKNFSFRVI